MRCILSKAGLVEHVIRRLTPVEALQFTTSCRETAQGARALKAAIVFAVTRPGVCTSNDLDVEMWEQIWASCAQSVTVCDLQPSVWARSRRWTYEERAGKEDDDDEEGRMSYSWHDPFPFLSSLMERAGKTTDSAIFSPPFCPVELVQRPFDSLHADVSADIDESANATVSAVLLLDACVQEHLLCHDAKNLSGKALVALSNGWLAFVFWNYSDSKEVSAIVELGEDEATVFLDRNLRDLFDLVSSRLGKDCHWTLSDDGTLTVTLGSECENEYLECLDFLHSLHKKKRLLIASQNDGLENIFSTFRTSFGASPQTRPTTEPIQEIIHVDPPALRDEGLLSEQADHQWAEYVEDRIRSQDGAAVSEGHDGEPPVQSARLSDKVYLISFRSGKSALFRKMLLEDAEFKPLRERLRDVGCALELPSGTIVLVRPDQYHEAVSCPALRSRKLKRHNVIIAESEEHLMNKVLLRMASKQRPRENGAEREELDYREVKYVSKRTFLCEAPKLRDANSVAQSTTEAVRSSASSTNYLNYFAHARGHNPRRHVQVEE